MKNTPFFLMPLVAALMSGCGQDTANSFSHALAMAKAKMTGQADAESAVSQAVANKNDVKNNIAVAEKDELLLLKQQLKRVQNQLTTSNAALRAAQQKLKTGTGGQRAQQLQQDQAQLKNERRVMDATTRHVKLLETQLSRQDNQLRKLQKTLSDTETGCREVAEELARNTRKAS